MADRLCHMITLISQCLHCTLFRFDHHFKDTRVQYFLFILSNFTSMKKRKNVLDSLFFLVLLGFETLIQYFKNSQFSEIIDI